MKKTISFILILSMIMSSALPVFADDETAKTEAAAAKTEADTEANTDADTKTYSDDLVTTKHSAVIQGQVIDYTATAGTMVVDSGDGKCEIFFIAYTKDGATDMTQRPITFTFNGGPGSASLYTDFLCMGPKRMEVDEIGHATQLPAKFTDNDNSLLDMTDLVFIDAIGTGYSRAIGNEDDFIGYDNDIRTIGDFIRLYINRNKRWGSPKYIAGESYGTTRAVGLCDYLFSTYSLGMNGLMLISTVNDFSSLQFSTGNDLPYASYLPTYAADAWYHGCLDKKYQDMKLEDYLDEVRDFVSEKYVPALYKGRRMTEDEKNEMAKSISQYTGLSEEFILESNLRITLPDFCKELLSDKKLMTGRLDGRFTGPVINGSIEDGESDPSGFDVDAPLAAASNQFIVDELNFNTDRPYIPLSLDVNKRWNFDKDNDILAQEEIINNCMAANSMLKVWVMCGYYDGATPFYGAEWVYNHVFLNDSRLDNLSFTYYPAGHMFYLDKDSFDQFRKDAEKFYK
ncbi:MAG: hypothetical protein IKQ56_01925 [Lachnospiraceae bacterium]|nr:hypothetical protein [Lachnospiraceae bacterium]